MSERGVAKAVAGWSRLLDQLTWRLTLVLTMVVVGVSGAFVAYEVGVHELQATYFERELMQNNVLAMNERQTLLDLKDANEEFQRQAVVASARGQAYLAAASSRQTALNADLLSLLAQEEFAASRALQPFVMATRSSSDGAEDDRAIQRRIARNVSKIGREPDASTDFQDMWKGLERKIENGHDRVRALAIAVVLFVASLVLFTFAGLTSKRTAHALLFSGIGFASVTGTGMMIIMPELRVAGAVMLVLLGICAVLAWKVGPPAKAAAEGHVEPAEVDVHAFAKGLHAAHASAGARNVVRWIAVTVLLSSISGLGYSFATIASSEATHEALRHEIEMHLRNTKRQADALDRLQWLARFQEERARFSAATQRAAYFKSLDATAAELAAAEARVYQLATEETPKLRQRLSRLSDELNQGTQDNSNFLQGTLRRIDSTRNDENHWESTAFWDLQNQRSLASSDTAAAFLWTLTLFAVAVYFFGQAVGMRKGITGRVLIWAGRGLVCIGLVYALFIFFIAQCRIDNGELACRDIDAREPTSGELYAASRFAYAHALLSDARSDDDYTRAMDAMSDAIATLPEWRLAQINFVSAVARHAMFAGDESFRRLPEKDSVEKTKDVMATALRKFEELNRQQLEQRKEPLSLLAGLGRYMWLDATVNGHEDEVGLSIKYLQRALERAKEEHGTDFDRMRIELNLAVARTISRDNLQADKHMSNALQLMRASQPPNTANPRLIARAITDFEIVATLCPNLKTLNCPQLRARTEELKARLIGATWGGTTADAPSGYVEPSAAGEIRLSVSATTAVWQGRLGTIGPNDTLAVVWYRFDDEWKVWRALYEISGKVDATELNTGGATRVERSYFESSSFTRCLSGDGAGRYRAEFYINMHRIDSLEITFRGSHYQAAQLHNLNVVLCRPSEWAAQPRTTNDGSLERGWTVGADKAMLKVYAFHVPTASAGARDPPLSGVLQLLRANLAKSEGTDVGPQAYIRYDRDKSADCELMMTKKAFVYVDWATPDGMRYVGVAAPGSEPTRDRSRDLCQALDSMTTLYSMSDLPRKAKGPGRQDIRAAAGSSRAK